MRAAVFHAPRDLRVEDVETPTAGEGELVVRVLASNTCGTDLKAYLRGHPLIRPPTTMGHEYAGEVREVGGGVTRFRKGDRVVASNSCPCYSCPMCSRGSYTLCTSIPASLIGFSIPGSYSEYLRVPRRIVNGNTYPLPANPSPEELACAEPLASAIHALDRLEIREGSRVAIVGTGAIGLMFLQLLKAKDGSVEVIMTNRSPERLSLAEELGADRALQVSDAGIVGSVREATGGGGPDVVIEAAGRRETWEDSFRMVREGGTVMMFGGCATGTSVSFDAAKLHYGEVTVLGSFHHEPSAFERAVRSIERGRVRVKPILSASRPLERIEEAFELMEERRALKVCVKP